MPLMSCTLAGAASASGMPLFSTAIWTFTPRIFLPPSTPRAKQLGAEGQVRLSVTTVLGSAGSPRPLRRYGCQLRQHLIHEGIDIRELSQEAGVVLAGRTALPIDC
nr:hypothetical protein [Azospirillum oryzae]